MRFYLACALYCTILCAQTTTEFFAQSYPLSEEILSRMVVTWQSDSPVPVKELRYLTVSYYDFQGQVKQGELVVHALAVDDLISIFKKLFEVRFPIHSMKFVDEFGSDDASMSANNTSAFYARHVTRTGRWSNHAYGLAIDINPLLNPYIRGEYFCPQEGERYLDRTLNGSGMITKDSYIYTLFKEHGWLWGGECFLDRGIEDLHHFQKVVPGLNENNN